MSSIICCFQTDLKALVAYSRVVHMRLLLGGLVLFSELTVRVVIIVSLSHGLVSALLFIGAG